MNMRSPALRVHRHCAQKSEEGKDSGSEEERKDNEKVEDICEANSPDVDEENVEAASHNNYSEVHATIFPYVPAI